MDFVVKFGQCLWVIKSEGRELVNEIWNWMNTKLFTVVHSYMKWCFLLAITNCAGKPGRRLEALPERPTYYTPSFSRTPHSANDPSSPGFPSWCSPATQCRRLLLAQTLQGQSCWSVAGCFGGKIKIRDFCRLNGKIYLSFDLDVSGWIESVCPWFLHSNATSLWVKRW